MRSLLLAAACLVASAADNAPQYTASGDLRLPANFREWVFLSSGIGMTYEGERASANPNPPFENVFVNPEAYQGYLKTGVWPDKTIMILEIRASESRVSINKDGRVQTRVMVYEAHVKEQSKGGWNFYQIGASEPAGKPFPKTAACFSCHEKNGASDTTFVQFYPTLIDVAKRHGTFKATE